MARFTILLPILRQPALLPFALASVLSQDETDFELFIVGDGAPPETAHCARAFAAREKRIKVFAFDKGERHGEAHRHLALEEATGTYVAQIGDDDLWFPDYLSTLGRLLEKVDFGNLLQVGCGRDERLLVFYDDLAKPATRRRMLEQHWNFFGPSFAGYRLAAYRRLPIGWSPAPQGIWTDLYMWRKFLACDGLTFGTEFAVKGAWFGSSNRAGMSLEDRVAEMTIWASRLGSEQGRERFVAQAAATTTLEGSEVERLIVSTSSTRRR